MEERRKGERRALPKAAPVLVLVTESAQPGAAARIALSAGVVTLGRDAANQLREQHADVSRFHCRVEPRPDGSHVIIDAGSTFGTWVDGVRIAGETKLRPGQVIGLGENGAHRIRVEEECASPSSAAIRPGPERAWIRAILAQAGATLDLEASLAKAVEIVAATLRAERVFVMLEHDGELVAEARGGVAARLAEDAELPLQAIERAIARAEVRQWMPDPGATDAIERGLLARGVTSAWFLPLHSYEGAGRPDAGHAKSFVGVVYADTRAAAPPRCDSATLDFLAVLAEVLALQLANARLYHRATHCMLTGLHARSWLDERLDVLLEKRAAGAQAALILADLDDFTRINETWGHDAGDDVLREVAARFRDTARSAGTACRHGGGEIAVLVPGRDADAALAVAEALRDAASARPVRSRGRDGAEVEIAVTASFGVAGLDAAMRRRGDFVKAASRALQRAKELGRGRVERA